MGGSVLLALFVLFALATGAAFVFGTPILGVPLLLVALGMGAAAYFGRRVAESGDIHQHREDAKAQKTEFTARDRRTLV
jgi:hypothetical protein